MYVTRHVCRTARGEQAPMHAPSLHVQYAHCNTANSSHMLHHFRCSMLIATQQTPQTCSITSGAVCSLQHSKLLTHAPSLQVQYAHSNTGQTPHTCSITSGAVCSLQHRANSSHMLHHFRCSMLIATQGKFLTHAPSLQVQYAHSNTGQTPHTCSITSGAVCS
jgi:hypothetical protein